ncbi:hypothetical protein BC826DRAFT_1013056 [Russula brevipes]|nr:hypothetical protein BC826DRAFT_1013056 [Russula brevipes]
MPFFCSFAWPSLLVLSLIKVKAEYQYKDIVGERFDYHFFGKGWPSLIQMCDTLSYICVLKSRYGSGAKV